MFQDQTTAPICLPAHQAPQEKATPICVNAFLLTRPLVRRPLLFVPWAASTALHGHWVLNSPGPAQLLNPGQEKRKSSLSITAIAAPQKPLHQLCAYLLAVCIS